MIVLKSKDYKIIFYLIYNNFNAYTLYFQTVPVDIFYIKDYHCDSYFQNENYGNLYKYSHVL